MEIKYQLEAKLYRVYQTEKYVIAIYKVTDVSGDAEGYYLEDFFIVTLDSGSVSLDTMTRDETPFGIGPNPEVALETAALEWDARAVDEEDRNRNPFKKILEEYFK